MRILLFLATNMAVLVLVSIVFNLLGLQGILAENGVDLNLGALLVFCAVFGFGPTMQLQAKPLHAEYLSRLSRRVL